MYRLGKIVLTCFWMLAFLIAMKPILARNLDSLEVELKSNRGDFKTRIKICDELSSGYLTCNPSQSRIYAFKGLKLAGESNNALMIARFTRLLGSSYTMSGSYDSAEVFLQKAQNLAVSLNDENLNSSIDLSFGTLLTRQKRYDEAMGRFINALRVFEKNGDQVNLRRTLGNIAALFMYQHNYSEAEQYYIKSEEISRKLNDHSGIGQACSGLTKIFSERGIFDKALDYAETSAKEFRLSGEKAYESLAYKEMANIFLKRKELGKAEEYGLKSYALAREAGLSRYIANSLGILSEIYFQKGEFAKSIDNSFRVFQTDSADPETNINMFSNIAKCYVRLGNNEEALTFFERYKKAFDRQVDVKFRESISDMEIRYQTEKKQHEIDRLTLIQQQHTRLNYLLFFLLILISAISFLLWRNFNHKKTIADQEITLKEKQIRELEKERQLIAAKSLLEGEELERARLAGDLHDGLGGLLSGIKLKLSFMKENAVITHENLAHFSHALDLLDSSITELRRVAHNLMPETLMHYGLRTALNDFIRQIVPEGKPVIGFNTFGGELRFNKELEVTVYRIAQELITNSVKHAHATRIDVQLFTEPTRVCVQVIDNGIGFNPEFSDPATSGKGLKSIRDRVTAFHGQFEISSQPGKGSESTVEFFVN